MRKWIVRILILALVVGIGLFCFSYFVGFGDKDVYVYEGSSNNKVSGTARVELREDNVAYMNVDITAMYGTAVRKIRGLGTWEEEGGSYTITIKGTDYTARIEGDEMILSGLGVRYAITLQKK